MHWNYLLVSIQVKTTDNVRGAMVRTLKMFLKNVQMDITSSKIQKVPKPVSSRTQQNLTTATKILNLYFLIVTINLLFKLKKARFKNVYSIIYFFNSNRPDPGSLGQLRSFEVMKQAKIRGSSFFGPEKCLKEFILT